jgi:16S rRNA (uracil1498-N3)-methyltransferase
MPCFYLPGIVSGGSVSMKDAEQLHHMRDVLRLKIGDEVTVFDGEGTKYSGRIAGLDRKGAILDITQRKEVKPSASKIAIACALPKKAKMDEIVDKLTQLGVDTIIPLMTERVIVKTDENKDRMFERWRKIALNAAEQCQRARLPVIFEITGFKELLVDSAQYSLKLIPTLEGERKSLKTVLSAIALSSILVLIGPEGDFSPQEVREAVERGFIPVSLGENVLRVDTAAIAVASYLRFGLLE